MPHYMYWLIAALALLGVEAIVGTFYVMVLSLACAMAGTVALAGLSLKIQVSVAVAATVIGLVMVYRVRASNPAAAGGKPAAGGPVKVVRWNEDGTARVHYQGEEWDAELEAPASADIPNDAVLYVKSMHGPKLLLTRRKP